MIPSIFNYGVYLKVYTIYHKNQVTCNVRAEIAQLFKSTTILQPFIILGLHLQHMESLAEIGAVKQFLHDVPLYL